MYPHHTEAALVTDGAGTYSGIELLSRLPYIGNETGIYFTDIFTTECGGGKSGIDSLLAAHRRCHLKSLKIL